MTRDEILAQRKNWPVGTVPYRQSGTSPWDQYRPDCSGGVSMCLGLATPGLSTVTLLTEHANYRIEWTELQPGDLIGIEGPGTGGDNGHVQLCIETDFAHSRVKVWEQTPPAGPYERWYYLSSLRADGFLPYRPSVLGEDDMAKLYKVTGDATIWQSDGMRRRARHSWPLVQKEFGQNPPIMEVASVAELDDVAGPVDAPWAAPTPSNHVHDLTHSHTVQQTAGFTGPAV